MPVFVHEALPADCLDQAALALMACDECMRLHKREEPQSYRGLPAMKEWLDGCTHDGLTDPNDVSSHIFRSALLRWRGESEHSIDVVGWKHDLSVLMREPWREPASNIERLFGFLLALATEFHLEARNCMIQKQMRT